MDGTYLKVAQYTVAAPTTILADTGGDAVLIWGAILYHTAAANATVTIVQDPVTGLEDAIRLGLAGAGSTGVMFHVPLYTQAEPDIDVLSDGEIYLYYTTTGSV